MGDLDLLEKYKPVVRFAMSEWFFNECGFIIWNHAIFFPVGCKRCSIKIMGRREFSCGRIGSSWPKKDQIDMKEGIRWEKPLEWLKILKEPAKQK